MEKYHISGINLKNIDMLSNINVENDFDHRMVIIGAVTLEQHPYDEQLFDQHVVGELKPGEYCLLSGGRLIMFNRLDKIPKISYLSHNVLNYDIRSFNGECHVGSMLLFRFLGNNLVTGYVDGNKGKRIVHTWIEDDKYAYDVSNNLAMSIDDYYELIHPFILNVISKEKYKEDIKRFSQQGIPFTDKLYCLYRDELMHDVEKNKQIYHLK